MSWHRKEAMVEMCYSRHDTSEAKRISVLADEIPIHDMRDDGNMCGIHYPAMNSAFLWDKSIIERTLG
jgi:hypothetical protein